jgi:3-oxoacyl-[acyl-carrier-protein] synthase II
VRYPLALTGWSASSPWGLGARAFGDGVRGGLSGLHGYEHAGPAEHRPPLSEVATVPGFEIREVLGRKNTRSMDRATGLAVATVGMLLEQQREAGHSFDGHDVGLVLGTTTGSVQSMMDFTRDSLTQEKPFLVDPARFPNTVMNCAAGQCAIWHDLRGPNTTIAAGQATGLSALNYAARLHYCGHADMVLCGAVEEFSVQRAWLECHAKSGDASAPVLGEGCAVFLVEDIEGARRAGRPVLAELLAINLRVYDGDPRRDLAESIRTGLSVAGVASEDVWAVSSDGGTDPSAGALDDVFGARKPLRIALGESLGDTGAASGALQLAAVLSKAEQDPAAHGRIAVVSSVDRDGVLGSAVLRVA